ncbi:MAG: alpha/beta hydrolase [Hyphomicrobiaceae bacterium]
MSVIDTRTAYDIDVADVVYLQHEGNDLLARIYRPRDSGAFPMMVDLHGGAWCNGDRHNDKVLCEALAASGVVVAALDFRQPPTAGYPAAMADINFGIRWLKSKAEAFGGDAERVGMFGISSGGQQAMLVAMRPDEPRYAAIQRPEVAGFDATVGCVVLCWPVIDPLGRYQYAQQRIAANDGYPKQLPGVIPNHDKFWESEDSMSEGSPVRILERGERIEMPPVLYVQGEADEMHPRPHLDRFVELYRERGGSVDLRLYPGEVEGFVTRAPNAVANQKDGTERIVAFVHDQLNRRAN